MKIRDEGFVRNKAVSIALGIQPDGTREVLGIWIEQTEGAKFWLRVMNELKNRGIADIMIAVVDGPGQGLVSATKPSHQEPIPANTHASPATQFSRSTF